MGRATFRRFLITVHVAKENEDSSGIESRRDLHRLSQLAATLAARWRPEYRPSREIAGLPESRSAGVTSTDRSWRTRERETERRREEGRETETSALRSGFASRYASYPRSCSMSGSTVP